MGLSAVDVNSPAPDGLIFQASSDFGSLINKDPGLGAHVSLDRWCCLFESLVLSLGCLHSWPLLSTEALILRF